jgi:hypothetical protein
VTNKKIIRPGEKVPLNLNDAERALVLEVVNLVDDEYLDAVRRTPPGQQPCPFLGSDDRCAIYRAAQSVPGIPSDGQGRFY